MRHTRLEQNLHRDRGQPRIVVLRLVQQPEAGARHITGQDRAEPSICDECLSVKCALSALESMNLS